GILVGADTGGSISGIASTGGCIDVSDAFLTVVVEICEGIRELDGATWNAYPNPGNGDLTLFNGSIEGLVRLDLLDLTGRSIHQEQWRNVRGQPQRISLAGHVAQGTYVLRIISASGRSEQRIVVR
ncbi:MAG TPA: T9SS type A sorting domain-containing protein, partial [Flavobacteriales bacterium]|nr:T9SS type A sorting domain-containing protein [Flavobacteriales bacterium]